MRLADQTIIVTGACSGLGNAMANAFVREGANVVFASHAPDRLATAVESITNENNPGDAIGVPTDIRSWDDVKFLMQKAMATFGPIDVLMNNAGVTEGKVNHDHVGHPVVDLPISTWDTMIETNLRGVFYCSKAVLPDMLDQESGRLIHTSSGHGLEGRAEKAAYCASKFGLEGFHESLAQELADTGVESLTIRPPMGGVFTETSRIYGRSPESYAHQDPTVIAETAVRLAGGEGTNGGRYKATPDGTDYVEYSRQDRL